MISNYVKKTCNSLAHDTIIGWKEQTQGSCSYIRYGTGHNKSYILKTPNLKSYNSKTFGEIIGSYYQTHLYYQHYNNLLCHSYGVFADENTCYQLLSYIPHQTKTFATYTQDDIRLLAKTIAGLHNTPIGESYSHPRYTTFSWRKYLFGERSGYEIYDMQRDITNNTHLQSIMQYCNTYYQSFLNQSRSCTLVHGDLHEENILFHDKDIVCIDPHSLGYGDPIIDIGTVIFRIELSYLMNNKQNYQQTQELFLSTYQSYRPDKEILIHLPLISMYQIGLLYELQYTEFLRKKYKYIIPHFEGIMNTILA